MIVVYVLMPMFWIALPVNLVIAGAMIGIFWAIRVKTLGPAGHLFKGAIQAAGSMSNRMEERKNARQVQLTYLRHDNTLMPLPKPQDPLAAGLGTADSFVIQALMRRAEMVDLSPARDGYALSLITDGIPAMQPRGRSRLGRVGDSGVQGARGPVGRGAAPAADRQFPLARCRGATTDLDRAHLGLDGGGAGRLQRQRKRAVGYSSWTSSA